MNTIRTVERRRPRQTVIDEIARAIVRDPDSASALWDRHQPSLAEGNAIGRKVRELRAGK